MTLTRPPASRPHPAGMARLAVAGLLARKLRACLSALGIMIGVAAITAVLGLSASAQAGLLAEIQALGTNLLTVSSSGAGLPESAPQMIARLPGVTSVQDIGQVSNVNVYRSPLIPAVHTNGLTVDAASLSLPGTLGTSLAQGSWLNAATAAQPVAVLGVAAAQRLGIDHMYQGERIWAGGMWWYVSGILRAAQLTPEIDSSVLIGYSAAHRYLGFKGEPTTVYLRALDTDVTAVDNLLAAQADPEDQQNVQVSQPSAALTARADAAGAFNSLFLGLGAVALLVGGIGVANIMVISVLERRSEIGLRRALGATKGHIRFQFLAEAMLLALAGGAAGVAAGAIATACYAHTRGWVTVIPAPAWAGGLGTGLLIGAVAGLWPALRAARLSPTHSLWTL
jgi:putative ABC transport system permease protein